MEEHVRFGLEIVFDLHMLANYLNANYLPIYLVYLDTD
jgi:hypothetical protein